MNKVALITGAMMKGRLIAFDNLLLRLSLRWLIHFLPRRMVLKISRISMEKKSI